jgi:hypothetical protein
MRSGGPSGPSTAVGAAVLFSPQPVDTVSDKLAAGREPDWPQTEKTCPPTETFWALAQIS